MKKNNFDGYVSFVKLSYCEKFELRYIGVLEEAKKLLLPMLQSRTEIQGHASSTSRPQTVIPSYSVQA